jgi:hypothetical protein
VVDWDKSAVVAHIADAPGNVDCNDDFALESRVLDQDKRSNAEVYLPV